MSKCYLKDLRSLSMRLGRVLPEPYWGRIVFSKADCAKTGKFDPPCAYLSLNCALGELSVADDGEIYMPNERGWDSLAETVEPGLKWAERAEKAVLKHLVVSPLENKEKERRERER